MRLAERLSVGSGDAVVAFGVSGIFWPARRSKVCIIRRAVSVVTADVTVVGDLAAGAAGDLAADGADGATGAGGGISFSAEPFDGPGVGPRPAPCVRGMTVRPRSASTLSSAVSSRSRFSPTLTTCASAPAHALTPGGCIGRPSTPIPGTGEGLAAHSPADGIAPAGPKPPIAGR